MTVHFRWMLRRDLPSVLSIENHSFGFPWNESDFIRCLRQRNIVGMVAEIEECVTGFFVYESHRSHIHLLSLAVHCCFKRRGIGTAIVEKLSGKLSKRRNRIVCEIRETNVDAQCFFRGHGFLATEVLRGLYDVCPEDAYRFEFQHERHAARSLGDAKT